MLAACYLDPRFKNFVHVKPTGNESKKQKQGWLKMHAERFVAKEFGEDPDDQIRVEDRAPLPTSTGVSGTVKAVRVAVACPFNCGRNCLMSCSFAVVCRFYQRQ